MKTQKGAAMVEFAMIALLFFMILFGIIEFGRAFFTYNTLVEATRRGARVAAVCQASDAGILMAQQAAIFGTPGGTQTTGLLGLTTADVSVTYLQADGTTVVAPPALADNSTSYNNIAYVQVKILSLNNSNSINLLIPGVSVAFPVPAIVTTLPSESLGRTSPINPPNRCCYGVGTCS
jgi:Flp pilus assembly protein TadG